MSKETRREIQSGERPASPAAVEQTRPGPVFTPAVDIFESAEAITVLADMPGVKAQDLKIDLRDSVLTLSGPVTASDQAKQTPVLTEYDTGTFFRQFSLSETIDQEKIEAQLTDGVLRLKLPKVERMKPRQITVRTG